MFCEFRQACTGNSELSTAQALEGLLADAEQLAGSVHSTAELSERVSKVRLLRKILSLFSVQCTAV